MFLIEQPDVSSALWPVIVYANTRAALFQGAGLVDPLRVRPGAVKAQKSPRTCDGVQDTTLSNRLALYHTG